MVQPLERPDALDARLAPRCWRCRDKGPAAGACGHRCIQRNQHALLLLEAADPAGHRLAEAVACADHARLAVLPAPTRRVRSKADEGLLPLRRPAGVAGILVIGDSAASRWIHLPPPASRMLGHMVLRWRTCRHLPQHRILALITAERTWFRRGPRLYLSGDRPGTRHSALRRHCAGLGCAGCRPEASAHGCPSEASARRPAPA